MHAPTRDAVDAALESFASAGAPSGQRLEHAPLLDRDQIAHIGELGVAVVGQPGLLGEVTVRYERLLGAAAASSRRPSRVRRWPSGLDDRGRFEVGMRADIVAVDGLLDRDPGACRVALTVVEGRTVHRTG